MNISSVSGAPEFNIDFDPKQNVKSGTERLESYACQERQPIVLDMINVLAAVEYADRSCRRSTASWAREIHLKIPVFESSTWLKQEVSDSLFDVISFLTGDVWDIEFVQREDAPAAAPQSSLALPREISWVMPFSDGVDSRAVAAIMEAEHPGSLQLVRVGSVGSGRRSQSRVLPFTRVPYTLTIPNRHHAETSGRSRGFKFALIAGIASYLGEVPNILVPESGQGMLGPAMTTYMHAWPDFRNSPRFFAKMEDLLEVLLGHRPAFVFPRIWNTKSETIRLARQKTPDLDLTSTRSCWMKQNMASLRGEYLQCGICAACLLRRMSFHSANVVEHPGTYVCDALTGDLQEVIPVGHPRRRALSEYGIAGAGQMRDFSILSGAAKRLEVESGLLAPILRSPEDEVLENLKRLICRHGQEWASFVGSFGPNSYLAEYSPGAI
jgi:hypothetical protein